MQGSQSTLFEIFSMRLSSTTTRKLRRIDFPFAGTLSVLFFPFYYFLGPFFQKRMKKVLNADIQIEYISGPEIITT